MAERRSTRTRREPSRHDVAEEPEDELAEEPDDELAEEPDDELAEEPDDELAEEPDDELAEEPDDELAEEEPEQAGGDDDGDASRRPRGHRDGLSAAQAGQAALRQIAELTGKEPEGVTGVEPTDDGWLVGVEVVEDRRIPSSTDILATYETEVDMGGNLVSYRRARRYTRGHGDEDT